MSATHGADPLPALLAVTVTANLNHDRIIRVAHRDEPESDTGNLPDHHRRGFAAASIS